MRMSEKCCHSCKSRIILDRREKKSLEKTILIIKRLRGKPAMTKTLFRAFYGRKSTLRLRNRSK